MTEPERHSHAVRGLALIAALVSVITGSCGSSSSPLSRAAAPASTTTTTAPPAGLGSGAELFVGGGVDVIAIGPGSGPAQVFLSAYGSTWRNVTPAGLTQQTTGGLTVELAVSSVSFVDPDHGWLYACSEASDTDGMFATTNGGRTWTALPPLGDCYNGDGPVQLLGNGLGYRELSAEPDRSPFQRTTDGGHTWQTVTEVSQTAAPWGTDFVFTDPENGYSASGIQGDPQPVPYGSLAGQGPGYFATTHDGGITWTASTPPVSSGNLRLYDLPTLTKADEEVLPALGGTDQAPVLDFDVSSDDGLTWTTMGTLSSTITAGADAFPNYPLPSVASSMTWWVYQPGPQPHIEVTTDGGATWSTNPYFGPQPRNLVAVSASTAFIVTGGPQVPNSEVDVTSDGGRFWHIVVLPEVVPILVEVEVAVPRLAPAVW
ncbi:MAG: WD40/YVTN/BNR-like repeat-containing protein [Acidimicrobiales bacterium]